MPDQLRSLISDPFAAATTAPRPGEIGQAPPPPRPSSLISLVDEDARLQDAARRTASTSPDRAARMLRLQQRTGFPVDLLERNLDEIERETAAADFDGERFRRESPRLAAWLAEHPAHLPLVNDDLRPLVGLERALGVGRTVVGAFGAGVMGFSRGVWGAIQAGAETVGASDVGAFAAGSAQIAEQLATRARGRRATDAGLVERGVYSGIESVGQMAPALVIGALTGPGALLATAGVTTGGQSYAEAREQGVDVGPALAFGGLQGAIEVATEYIPAHRLLGDLAKQSGLLTTLARQVTSEIPGEQIATVLQDLNEWAVLPENRARTFGDYLRERPSAAAATAIATLTAVGLQTTIAHGTAGVLEQLDAAARDSKTRTRTPDQLEHLAAALTRDGGPATVYVPLDRFTEYFQSQQLDPVQVAQQLTGEAEAFARARETGEDLAVPMGRYLTQLAGTPHAAFFSEEARLAPNALNVRETRTLEQTLVEELHAAQQQPVVAANEDTQGLIRDAVTTLLTSVGIAPPIARVYASFYESTFQTIAARAGVDPITLFERYGLSVERSLVPGQTAAAQYGQPAPEPEFVALGAEAVEAAERRSVQEAQTPRPDVDEPIAAMRDIAAAAARMLTENPDLPAQADALRQRVTAARAAARGEPVPPLEPSRQASDRPLARPGETAPTTQRADLETRIRVAREQGREDLDAVRALQELREADQSFGQPEREGDGTQRGAIRFGPDRQTVIELFGKADLSTFLHESAHLYLEVFGDVVADVESRPADSLTDLQRQVLADYRTLLGWLGVPSRDQIGRAQHEQFARGFEAYLMEGQAPSPAMRSIFGRVRAWLLKVYRSLGSLRVELSPEIRGVLDRLLATDEAIAAAQRDARAVPLLTETIAAAAGLSEADRARYRATVEAADQRARETLDRRLLAEAEREHANWWAAERATIRADVAAELHERPVYRALALLQHGRRPDGSPLPPGVQAFKLDLRALMRDVGPEAPLRLPPGITAKRNGVAPAIAAELLGFRSVGDLVKALAQVQPLQEAIERETDARLKARHGDMLLDGTVLEHARGAVLDASTDVIVEELRALRDAVSRQPGARPVSVLPLAAVRAFAEQRIAGLPIREIRPQLYAAAARRSADEAIDAAGRQEFRRALDAKRRQVLNAELYRAAVGALDMVESNVTEWRQRIFASDASLAPRYNMDLVQAARALLAQFHLAPTVAGAAAHTYLSQVAAYDPDLFNDLQAAIDAAAEQPRPYRDLTVDEFAAVRDAVGNLWQTARRSRQIVIEGQARELDDVRKELQARLAAITPKGRQAYKRKLTTWAETRRYLLGFRAALRRVEHWVDAIDGGDPRGVFRRVLFTPVSEAASRYREAKKTTLERYLAIVKGVESSLTPQDIPAPELDYTFSGKAELLHALLHTGNESNLRKLLLGDHESRPRWGEVRPDGTLDTSRWDGFVGRLWSESVLTKAEYDYVQAVWDLLEEQKPQAQQVHHDIYGYYFSEITARELVTPFGTYRGGYVPAIYDPFLDDDAARRADKEAVDHTPNSFMFPTTGRGFTMQRIDEYARPLMLDLRVLPLHLDKVLRFIHLQPVVKERGRLLINKSLRRALGELDPTVAGELLIPWLQRAARQTVDTPAQGWGGRGADRFFRALRRRTGLQIMVGNVLNALQQLTGLSMAGVKVPLPALSRALWRYVRGPKVLADLVSEKSAFMRTRTTTQTIEIQQHIDDLLLNPTRYEQARAFATKHGYFLQAGLQNVVDVITWSAGYDEAIADGATEPNAVRQADAAVRETQGSFNPEDLSKWETGSPAWRMFSMFYSYFNMQANLLGSQFAIAIRDLGLKAGAGRLLYVYTFGFLIPAVLSELIIQAGRGEWDEDEDGNVLDDLLALFVGAQQRTATAMVPLVGPIINAGIGTFTKVRYDDRISVSPAVTALESAARAPHSVYEAIVNDGRKKTAIRDTLTTIGLLTGLPVAPLGRPLGYLADVQEGEVEPEGPADVARGLVTGR